MTNLSNKVALVTGSSRGIGKEIALRYASLGAKLIINYTNGIEAANDVVAIIKNNGGEAIAIQADISKIVDLENLFKSGIAHFGKIDIVVASAGIEIINTPIVDLKEEQYDKLFAINTKGALFTLQVAARNVTDGGRIIYIGSSSTTFPIPGNGWYGSSKMAARFMVQVLAQEIGHRKVTVNAIIPTAIQGAGVFTHIEENDPFKAHIEQVNPMGRMGTPKDVADVAEFFASDLSGFVSGQYLLISGGALG